MRYRSIMLSLVILSVISPISVFAQQLPSPPGLISPANNSSENTTNVLFQWNSVSSASNYEIEVATDDNMQNIVADGLYLEYYQSEIDALRIIRRDVK